ncbi:hypothetical protein C7212DRAFT_346567 [Tuber magnatum]|uniref:Uncharacterized protein n=1 Tax=Tuber magnatum TaxID=42249 RepID=A0A317SH61_9PEZI|nr:hypothetical protein C7212DRAFT_346567 [Tuber magnatum]
MVSNRLVPESPLIWFSDRLKHSASQPAVSGFATQNPCLMLSSYLLQSSVTESAQRTRGQGQQLPLPRTVIGHVHSPTTILNESEVSNSLVPGPCLAPCSLTLYNTQRIRGERLSSSIMGKRLTMSTDFLNRLPIQRSPNVNNRIAPYSESILCTYTLQLSACLIPTIVLSRKNSARLTQQVSCAKDVLDPFTHKLSQPAGHPSAITCAT